MSQQPPYGQPPQQPPYEQPPGQPPGNQPPWQGQPPPEVHYHQYAAPPPQKKRMGCFKIGAFALIGVVAIIVIIGVASSAGNKGSTTSAPNTGASGGTSVATALPGLNQTVTVKNWDMTVTGVEKIGKTLIWSQFGNQSDAAGTWVVVAVDMKNTGSTNFGINDHDFQLKDGAGNTYKVTSDFGAGGYGESKGGQRIGGQVPPGTTVRYYVVFDVTPTATGLTFQFLQDKKPVVNLGQNAS